jgi:hypothetical protein
VNRLHRIGFEAFGQLANRALDLTDGHAPHGLIRC